MMKINFGNIIFLLVFALLTLIFPLIFFRNIILTTFLLVILAIVGLIKWNSKLTLIMFIFGGVGGGVAEIIAVYFGVWQYSLANVFNVPLWLFFVWGNASAFLYQTACELKNFGVKK